MVILSGLLLLLVSSLVILAPLVVYRLLWRHRYAASGVDGPFHRIRGKIVAPGDPGTAVLGASAAAQTRFELEVPDREGALLVESGGPMMVVRGRRISVGDRVTVDAIDTNIRLDEALYRHSALQPAVAALRVSRGTWPRLPFLTPVMVGAGLLALGSTVALGLQAPAPRGALVCPDGAVARGDRPPRKDLQWCELGDGRGSQEGVKHGPWIMWWNKVRRRQAGQYMQGVPHGAWSTWHDSGIIATRTRYDRGYRTGTWLTWDRFGRLRKRQAYGAAGLPHGQWTSWYENGRIKESTRHERGELSGRKVSWHRNGRVAIIAQLVDGRRHGPFSRWDEHGRLRERGSYNSGVYHGIWATWDGRGRLLSRGPYARGSRCGSWEIWRHSDAGEAPRHEKTSQGACRGAAAEWPRPATG